jgi:hypothetical protein
LLKAVSLAGIGASCLAGPPASQAADSGDGKPSRFVDPADGHFDLSNFIDTAYGFVPLLVPITEPAVGYGAAAALVFVDSAPQAEGPRHQRPNIATAGGLRTENGTDGLFAGHLGTWQEGRLRTQAAIADLDVNLEFFGLGGDRVPGQGLDYTVAGRGGVLGAAWRLGASDFWLGGRYSLFDTEVAPAEPDAELPGVAPTDLDLRLASVTWSLTLDRRNNFFTPTHGWYVDLSVPLYRESLGSDRDFHETALTVMYFRPLGRSLYLGVRGTARTSSDGTPFYLRPFVTLRGVQALGYQGEEAAEIETELRWQFHPRWSVVGFAGAGAARSDLGDGDEHVAAGGAGFRYLIARRHGLHVGLDVAAGPDETAVYVIFGNAWLRP